MDERRKYAYRYLLYKAMLDIRPILWVRLGLWQRLNPFVWRETYRQIRTAGGIADWLHNLAHHAALDFRNFDEIRFWRDCQQLRKHCSDSMLQSYRAEFDRQATASPNSESSPV
jgi:hypothetical protein